MTISRPDIILPLLFLGLVVLVLTSACMGSMSIPVQDVLGILASPPWGSGSSSSAQPEVQSVIIWDVRLPRILTAAAVGAGLASSGAVFQGILLNPLAEPYTLGVSAGAAFGASLVLLFGLNFLGFWSLPLMAFAGAGLTMILVLSLSSTAGGFSSTNLILSGVIVTSILSAGMSFLKYLAQEDVSVIVFWLLGSFASSTWSELWLVCAFLGVTLILFMCAARDLNLLCLGSRVARSMGVNSSKTRLFLLLTGSLLAAVCVSVSGIIGFVGLVVPHMMRFLTGPDHRLLLPGSVLAGALLLLAADTITRALLPQEVPIGILTALLGGPFFFVIFRSRRMQA
ncbi:MAG: iron ABC transporter permease [Desulfovermiculus sp.]